MKRIDYSDNLPITIRKFVIRFCQKDIEDFTDWVNTKSKYKWSPMQNKWWGGYGKIATTEEMFDKWLKIKQRQDAAKEKRRDKNLQKRKTNGRLK